MNHPYPVTSRNISCALNSIKYGAVTIGERRECARFLAEYDRIICSHYTHKLLGIIPGAAAEFYLRTNLPQLPPAAANFTADLADVAREVYPEIAEITLGWLAGTIKNM